MTSKPKNDLAVQSLLEARAQIDVALRQLGYRAPVLRGSLAARIKQLRSDLRLSLQEVADRAGITKSHAWEIEQGRAVNPTVQTVHGLASALGVDFADLALAA